MPLPSARKDDIENHYQKQEAAAPAWFYKVVAAEIGMKGLEMMRNILLLAAMLAPGLLSAEKLTVYTDRPLDRLQPIAERFTARTGTPVELVSLQYEPMRARLREEGANTPADLLFVKDLVYLTELADAGLLTPIGSEFVAFVVPRQFRHPEDLFTAITYRARTIVYAKGEVDPSMLSTYEDLASDKWREQLCLRRSAGGYNEALVGSFVVEKGEAAAEAIVAGWVANLATPDRSIFPNDTAMINAIANGECKVGIANSYYLAQLLKVRPNLPVGIFFANQNERGTHVNGTGVGIVKGAAQIEAARIFTEELLSDQSQLELSSAHMDFPVSFGLLSNEPVLREFGSFRLGETNWLEIGRQAPTARAIFQRVKY